MPPLGLCLVSFPIGPSFLAAPFATSPLYVLASSAVSIIRPSSSCPPASSTLQPPPPFLLGFHRVLHSSSTSNTASCGRRASFPTVPLMPRTCPWWVTNKYLLTEWMNERTGPILSLYWGFLFIYSSLSTVILQDSMLNCFFFSFFMFPLDDLSSFCFS